MNITQKLNQAYLNQLYHFLQLKKSQWNKEEVITKIQEKKLRAIIKNAYQNVPFYHDLFDSVGLKPQDVNYVDDLERIPILKKEDVRKGR